MSSLKLFGFAIALVTLNACSFSPQATESSSSSRPSVSSRPASSPNPSTAERTTPANTITSQAWKNAQLVRTIEDRTVKGDLVEIYSIAISPDGKTLASGGSDGTTKIWNMQTGKLLGSFTAAGDSYSNYRTTSVAFSTNGKILAAAQDVGNNSVVMVWDLKMGELLYQISGAGDRIAITPDSQTLASGVSERNKIKLWDLRTGELQQTLSGNLGYSAYSLSTGINGSILGARGSGGSLDIWNLRTGELVLSQKFGSSQGEADSIAIHPDGQTFAISRKSRGSSVQFWNLNSGKLIRTLEGHSATVSSVAISPDGQVLVSGSEDGTIRIVNSRTRELIRVLRDAGSVTSISFSSDGRTLASSNQDGEIKIWQVPE